MIEIATSSRFRVKEDGANLYLILSVHGESMRKVLFPGLVMTKGGRPGIFIYTDVYIRIGVYMLLDNNLLRCIITLVSKNMAKVWG